MAETKALDERLIGLVVHLGQKLATGCVATGAQAFVELEGATDSHGEGAELARDAQLASGRRQDEPCLAALARVLNKRGGFLETAHREASTDGKMFSGNERHN
jgi:hypothetical protein